MRRLVHLVLTTPRTFRALGRGFLLRRPIERVSRSKEWEQLKRTATRSLRENSLNIVGFGWEVDPCSWIAFSTPRRVESVLKDALDSDGEALEETRESEKA